jgi:hypothetical protein
MMTRKHFQLFADTIATMTDETDQMTLARVCVIVFQQSNPRFDARRFLEATGLPRSLQDQVLEESSMISP